MRTRALVAVATSMLLSTSAWATPEDFDFFQFDLAVGAGGTIDDDPVGPELNFDFVTAVGSGSVEALVPAGQRTLFSRFDYSVDVTPGPGSLLLTAEFDAAAEFAYATGDTNSSMEAFASFDGFFIEFTLDAPHFIELSGLSGTLDGLDGTPDFGHIDNGTSYEVPAGTYELYSSDGLLLIDAFNTSDDGNALFASSLSVGLQITAVPGPASVGMLAVAGLAATRRRRS